MFSNKMRISPSNAALVCMGVWATVACSDASQSPNSGSASTAGDAAINVAAPGDAGSRTVSATGFDGAVSVSSEGSVPTSDGANSVTDGQTDAATSGPATGPFPAVTDFSKPGPYQTTTQSNVGPNSNYTVYQPTLLAPDGAKNPIVSWMNGGATTNAFYSILPFLASHGLVIVASNTIPSIGDEVALGKEISAGLDWAIAENTRPDSMLFGKLDTTHVAAAGYSMGSLATFTIASDARLTTTLHISGGNMAPERVNNLRAPAAFICGIPGDSSCSILSTDCDIAAANCDTDFANAKTPVFYANFAGGHLGILSAPNDALIASMSAAWLRYKLMADSTLEALFVGSSCTYCADSHWKVHQKNLP